MIRQDKILKATTALRAFAMELADFNAEERIEIQKMAKRIGDGMLEPTAVKVISKATVDAIDTLNKRLHPSQ